MVQNAINFSGEPFAEYTPYVNVEYELEKQGWVWLDIHQAEQLEKGKTYRIAIGREHWHLRYGGLHEWFASKVPGEHEVPANSLIEAGCPVFARRAPVKWEGVARMVYSNTGSIMLEDLDGPPMPEKLRDNIVVVSLVEAIDPDALPVREVIGEDYWSRG